MRVRVRSVSVCMVTMGRGMLSCVFDSQMHTIHGNVIRKAYMIEKCDKDEEGGYVRQDGGIWGEIIAGSACEAVWRGLREEQPGREEQTEWVVLGAFFFLGWWASEAIARFVVRRTNQTGLLSCRVFPQDRSYEVLLTCC